MCGGANVSAFFAPEVVEQALYNLGDHYDPTSAEQNVADAQAIIDALRAAGFRVMRTGGSTPDFHTTLADNAHSEGSS